MSADEVVASDVPPRYLLSSLLVTDAELGSFPKQRHREEYHVSVRHGIHEKTGKYVHRIFF